MAAVPKIFDQPAAAFDKYVLLQAENSRLRRQLRKAHEAMKYWKELSLYFQDERDYYREQTQEGGKDAL